MKVWEPETHEGIAGGRFYAIPTRRGGTANMAGGTGRLHARCWTVYYETLCTNIVCDTYEEANDEAERLATVDVLKELKAKKEGWKAQPTYGHFPGLITGVLEDDEVAA